MKILLTFDYELYFGERTGSVEKCLIQPTEMLFDLCQSHGLRTVQFVDTEYLLRMRTLMRDHSNLTSDYNSISTQLRKLSEAGHELQLHIHPHWQNCQYSDKKWIMNTEQYRLQQLPADEADEMIARGSALLTELSGKKPIAFRAGGWCIQPFAVFSNELARQGIFIDSSVFSGGYYQSERYYYDFRKVPEKSSWYFADDVTLENTTGPFREIAISSIHNSPLFYWKLFLLGRLNPAYHKPMGDGIPVAAPGQRKSLLSRSTWQTVSVDGYNASLLNSALKQLQKSGRNEMVIIGHPKALTRFGLKALDRFIAENKDRHDFITFGDRKP